MDVFIILQFSRSLHIPYKSFSGENKERKTTTLQEAETYHSLHFNTINIAECWSEISCSSYGAVINQRWSTQVLIATFSQMALFDS